MQDGTLAHDLARYMREKGVSQKNLAKLAGVHQSTVSRALSCRMVRLGKAKARLCKYMQQQIGDDILLDGRSKVINAFEAIWDGSDAHASAIARIIKASEGLRPDGK